MSTIIAAHVQLQDQADAVRQALCEAGFGDDQISQFYVNPPGQHDLTPIGGDRPQSPGAMETPAGVVEGVATGTVVGAVIGTVTAPATGPLGPALGALVGAHIGSLYSFAKMKEADEPEEGGTPGLLSRPAGVLVAVALSESAQEERAMAVLRQLGVAQIERAEGTIVDGDWVDFDPLSPPVPLH